MSRGFRGLLLVFISALLSQGALAAIPSHSPALESPPKSETHIPASSTTNQPNRNGSRTAPNSEKAIPIDADQDNSARENQVQKGSAADWLLAKFTGMLVLVGLFQLALFYWQLQIMKSGINDATTTAEAAKRSAELAEQSMIVESRAYIFATGIYTDCIPQDDGSYFWKLRPNWTNTGKTPTRNLLIYVDYDISDKPKNKGELDLARVKYPPGHGHSAPYQTMRGGQIPNEIDRFLTPDLVEELISGKKCLYMWGWAKYRDVFRNTEEHITKFCWYVVPVGYPRAFKLHSTKLEESLVFNYIVHNEGNCSDDECNNNNAG